MLPQTKIVQHPEHAHPNQKVLTVLLPSDKVDFDKLDDISKEIAKLIDNQIKPAVASDGGNILFQSYDSDSLEVKVILQGACSGCPSSTYTLKNGIETMLKDYLPGKISNVVAING